VKPVGLLVMAYGTADGPDDIERYYTDIRGGRAPSAEHLRELEDRYAAIGNRFPLLDTTREQAERLAALLTEQTGREHRPYLGMKHSPPFISGGVARMCQDGIERAIGIVMAPHWSQMSIETYVERALAALEHGGPEMTFLRQWHDHPAFVAFLAERVRAALDTLPPSERERVEVIFSAHSLPQRTEADGTTRCLTCHECPEGCRYAAGLRETADLVAAEVGLGGEAYTTGWQSAGRTAHPWLGPPVEDVIRDAAAAGRTAIVSCSAGFVADHLEVLYDLDIEAREVAGEVGLGFVRTEMPNADPAFIEALAQVVRDHLAE